MGGVFPTKTESSKRDSPGSSVKAPEITAVVVTHNSARHLEALGRALEGSTRRPTRMLVVDNASEDDTIARARSTGFEVHETDSNDGFGAGCNAGLHAASTELVLFCNPDALPSRTALERLSAALIANPTAAIAGAMLSDSVAPRQFSHIATDVMGFFPGWVQRKLPSFSRGPAVCYPGNHIIVDYAPGAFILCRAAALQSVNGFDESFFLYSEEEDLSRRLAERRWKTILVPSAFVAHEHNASSEKVDAAAMAPFRFHSLYWYYRKYHSRGYAEFARCAIAICVLIDSCYRRLLRRREVYRPTTAIAPFRHIHSLRREHERRAG